MVLTFATDQCVATARRTNGTVSLRTEKAVEASTKLDKIQEKIPLSTPSTDHLSLNMDRSGETTQQTHLCGYPDRYLSRNIIPCWEYVSRYSDIDASRWP
ncbi:hypothetical protein A2480_03810 [Candidatus Uhrbacteria bacterium RIFOXYC2_FULL_47_19]|uniref:Uncharacterized protein n=1 Tax=Candidatus Uhrbacteria bacterium RIFOXYC2_FULL_47_19 TaxID=1802424 RepID=A0A1F7WC41_9BACT|nr:MAG: hypothetical protein A2480_03810 [Candidatus Uhrbacteria bacterium RIFOXYC2_FULL_47_19]